MSAWMYMPQVVETCSWPRTRAIIVISVPCSSKDMAQVICSGWEKGLVGAISAYEAREAHIEVERRLRKKKLVRDQSAPSLTSLGHYRILVRHDSVCRLLNDTLVGHAVSLERQPC